MKWLFGLLGGLGVIGCIVTVLITLVLYIVVIEQIYPKLSKITQKQNLPFVNSFYKLT